MTSSRVPALTDAWVAALTTASAAASWAVVDGPFVSDSGPPQQVFVGYDGDPNGEGNSAATTQEWAGLGANAKNEDISLTCAVLVQLGSTDVSTLRATVFSVFADVEAVVRADPSLGLPSPTVCAITEHTFFTEQTTQGVQGRLPFTLRCTTRI